MRTCRSPIGLFLTKGRTHPIVGRHPAEESIVRSFRVLSQKSFEGSLKHRAIEPKLELKISFISQLLNSRGNPKESISGKSLHPNIFSPFDQFPTTRCTRPARFQIKTTKSDARRLSNYFNQSLDQFFQLNSLLFQPSLILYKPFLRLKEFILYTL